MYNKCTYTAETLKESIFKVLGSYSRGGEEISVMSGFAADADKKYISALNMCLRRVALNMPLCKNTGMIVFEKGRAVLPCDCYKVIALADKENGVLSECDYYVGNGFILSEKLTGEAYVTYAVMPDAFTEETPGDTPVNLPDITADALVYLTASELCPSEYGELFSKLMYKYRDIALNCYNTAENAVRRNSFFGKHTKSLRNKL